MLNSQNDKLTINNITIIGAGALGSALAALLALKYENAKFNIVGRPSQNDSQKTNDNASHQSSIDFIKTHGIRCWYRENKTSKETKLIEVAVDRMNITSNPEDITPKSQDLIFICVPYQHWTAALASTVESLRAPNGFSVLCNNGWLTARESHHSIEHMVFSVLNITSTIFRQEDIETLQNAEEKVEYANSLQAGDCLIGRPLQNSCIPLAYASEANERKYSLNKTPHPLTIISAFLENAGIPSLPVPTFNEFLVYKFTKCQITASLNSFFFYFGQSIGELLQSPYLRLIYKVAISEVPKIAAAYGITELMDIGAFNRRLEDSKTHQTSTMQSYILKKEIEIPSILQSLIWAAEQKGITAKDIPIIHKLLEISKTFSGYELLHIDHVGQLEANAVGELNKLNRYIHTAAEAEATNIMPRLKLKKSPTPPPPGAEHSDGSSVGSYADEGSTSSVSSSPPKEPFRTNISDPNDFNLGETNLKLDLSNAEKILEHFMLLDFPNKDYKRLAISNPASFTQNERHQVLSAMNEILKDSFSGHYKQYNFTPYVPLGYIGVSIPSGDKLFNKWITENHICKTDDIRATESSKEKKSIDRKKFSFSKQEEQKQPSKTKIYRTRSAPTTSIHEELDLQDPMDHLPSSWAQNEKKKKNHIQTIIDEKKEDDHAFNGQKAVKAKKEKSDSPGCTII